MTQEDKDLLLKDLCARLPYGVIVGNVYGHKHKVAEINCDFGMMKLVGNNDEYFDASILTYKPYLRPMSSMTEEEKETYEMFFNEDGLLNTSVDTYLDWLLDNHFDYRGLIPRGLALPATEEMYKR